MSTNQSRGVLVEKDGKVGILTFDRPHRRNAMDAGTREEVALALADFQDDMGIAVVVLTGSGTAFCSGTDLKGPSPKASSSEESLTAPFDRFQKPLIAAVNGPAAGGGFEIALASQIRLASTSAVFMLPEVRIGSIPGSGGTQRLFDVLPASIAWELLLEGGQLGAQEALSFGLVNDVLAEQDLMERSLELATSISRNAPLSLQAVLTAGKARSQGSHNLELERVLWRFLATTEDRAEGRKAFREKRPPQYRGR